MYIHTSSMPIDWYGKTTIKCPPYSKPLHIHIRNQMLYLTFRSETYVSSYVESNWKTFDFIILQNLIQNNSNVPNGFEYFETIKMTDDDVINYYHLFIQENISVEEQRDGKITELMNQDF